MRDSRDDDECSNSNSNGDDEEIVPPKQRSDSPDEESSLFDTSAVDTTQDTTLTEPDAEAVAPTPPRPRRGTMTREEARRSAETLRLRLGLASYKVRTGQTDVPLELLKVKPLLPATRRGGPSLPPLPAPRNLGAIDAEGGNDDGGVGDADEGHHGEAKTPARKALPNAPSVRSGDTLGSGHPAPERKLLPELAASALNVHRGR